jgi:hypothetical protein
MFEPNGAADECDAVAFRSTPVAFDPNTVPRHGIAVTFHPNANTFDSSVFSRRSNSADLDTDGIISSPNTTALLSIVNARMKNTDAVGPGEKTLPPNAATFHSRTSTFQSSTSALDARVSALRFYQITRLIITASVIEQKTWRGSRANRGTVDASPLRRPIRSWVRVGPTFLCITTTAGGCPAMLRP